MWFGIVLIVVGVVFLLQNLGYVTGEVWNVVWPAFIILLGITMVLKKDKKIVVNAPENDEEEKK